MKYVLLLLSLLGIVLYMHWAYARIYSTIGLINLPNPTTHQVIEISPASGMATKKITYVAMGDSLTAGVGSSSEDKTYPYQLAQSFANNQQALVTLVNLAWPGATAKDVLINQVPLVGKFKPDIITLATGVNDMHNQVPAAEFTQTVTTIIDIVASTTEHHATVINIPFIGEKSLFPFPYRVYFDWQTRRYNGLLKQAITGRMVQVIDLYSLTREKAMAGSGYYSTDHFHPSEAGYRVWGNALYDYFNS